MKKTLWLFIAMMICILSLTSCFHTHEWEDPTCFNPKTCIDCGETEGEPLEHMWIEPTCVNVKYCSVCGYEEGEALGHDWDRATCTEPKQCSICGQTEGEPLFHKWVDATCTSAAYCSRCYTTSGTPIDHNWTKAKSNTPSECLNCGEMRPLDLPKSGKVFTGANLNRGSKLKIKSSSEKSCYIKLKNTRGKDVFSFFVRAGETVNMSVPQDNFYVYFSYGTDWYGTEHLFGPKTTYTKDDELLNFKKYTWEYTLYPTQNGNFKETPIDAEEFK